MPRLTRATRAIASPPRHAGLHFDIASCGRLSFGSTRFCFQEIAGYFARKCSTDGAPRRPATSFSMKEDLIYDNYRFLRRKREAP